MSSTNPTDLRSYKLHVSFSMVVAVRVLSDLTTSTKLSAEGQMPPKMPPSAVPPHCISASTTDQPMVAPPTLHLGAAFGQYSTHRVASGGQWQRRLVDGVVGGRVRGGHGHHQPQLLDDHLQAGPLAFPLAPLCFSGRHMTLRGNIGGGVSVWGGVGWVGWGGGHGPHWGWA